ncbi:deoxyribose-phosphate aldolase [Christiangramia salexigens]|uniref:Deoxyribose-phosphate aldolase n=1 Tax=Christiangramia salexigens TaxID=1913577 RepID=A0A1L3J1W6_9FLAO|nr:deoxyribose-phosphate aldolase [Christiangramia salexigens]APG59124.1 deoxyribose-phosphate aldolase [Christiangramia salexigens]
MKLNEYIDHTLLSAQATKLEVIQLCKEALTHNFYAVCVNSSYTKLAKEVLAGSNVKIAVTIGFPLGAVSSTTKEIEAVQAFKDGADELDMVINIGALKNKDYEKVKNEISDIKNLKSGKILKVIIETCYLNPEEIVKASELAMQAGADFVKTSTGFGTRGASKEDILIMKETVGENMRIKASGGIRDRETALDYIHLGADRIGTSSGIKIMTETP